MLDMFWFSTISFTHYFSHFPKVIAPFSYLQQYCLYILFSLQFTRKYQHLYFVLLLRYFRIITYLSWFYTDVILFHIFFFCSPLILLFIFLVISHNTFFLSPIFYHLIFSDNLSNVDKYFYIWQVLSIPHLPFILQKFENYSYHFTSKTCLRQRCSLIACFTDYGDYDTCLFR